MRKKFKYRSKELVNNIDWTAYNQAQLEEMDNQLILIRNMVNEASERIWQMINRKGKGRPAKDARDKAKAILVQQYFMATDRFAAQLVWFLREKLENPDSKTEWYDIVGKREARKMIKKSLSDGKEILEQLDSFGVPVYIVPGNWDWTKDEDSDWDFLKQDSYRMLIRDLSNIIDIHHRIVDIENYQIIGHGVSSGPEYPQYKEDLERLKPEELTKRKSLMIEN